MAEDSKKTYKTITLFLLRKIMPKWDLTEKQIYKLLKHPCQKEKSVIEEITSAYLEFVEDLFDYLNKEHDNKIRIRQLNMSLYRFWNNKSPH